MPPPLQKLSSVSDKLPSAVILHHGAVWTDTTGSSMCHCVDDRVHAQAVSVARKFGGIIGIVHPFPGVAEVGVVGDQDHQAAGIVEHSPDMRLDIVGLLPGSRASIGIGVHAAQTVIRRLQFFVDVEETVKYLVTQWNV